MTTGGTLTPELRERLVELFGPDGALELMDRVPQAPWHELAGKSDVADARAATKAEFGGLRAEFGGLRAQLGGLRAEFGGLRAEFGGLRTEFADLRTEFSGLRGEFVDLRTEMRRDFATKDELRWAVETSEHRLQAEITSNASSNLRFTVSTIMIGNATVIASVIAAFVALR